MRYKKGSLNLSIQAIVILVMAMAVLGLGLGFIRTLIGQGQTQFEDAIGGVELENPPSTDQPFTVDANIKVKNSGEGSFKVGLYNNGNLGSDAIELKLGTCVPTPAAPMTLRSVAQTISEGNYASYKLIIVGNNAGQGTYVCALYAIKEGGTIPTDIKATKQIQITVTS